MAAKERDLRFDYLKAIGLICIILAHTLVGNSWLFQLRNFDVILMVLSSGALFYYSSKNKNYSFLSYLKKRVPRLIIPVWSFFSFFFIFVFLEKLLRGQSFPFTDEYLKNVFILANDGGYVWIIRVFLLIGIISVPLQKLRKKLDNDWHFLALLTITLLGYLFFIREVSIENFFIQEYIYYLIPYSFVFGLGMLLPKAGGGKEVVTLTTVSWLIFFSLMAYYYNKYGGFVQTQAYKYPPKLYYLAYGLAGSLILYLITSYKNTAEFLTQKTKNKINQIIIFLSSSTLWIYLWHKFFIYNYLEITKALDLQPHWIFKFIVILILSSLTTLLQQYLLQKFLSKIKNRRTAKVLNYIFN